MSSVCRTFDFAVLKVPLNESWVILVAKISLNRTTVGCRKKKIVTLVNNMGYTWP